jgi:hypothetical protein
MTENIVPSIPELWDEDEAIERITNDGLLDTIEVMNEKDWRIKRCLSHAVMFRAQSLLRIRSSISIAKQLGKIKSHDTPANWIAWAKHNGYEIGHLNSLNCIQKLDSTTGNYREHELRSLIKKVFMNLDSPENNTVWNALKKDAETEGQNKKYDKEEIIQEMDRETIYWSSWRRTEQEMARRTFNNYLSELRKP